MSKSQCNIPEDTNLRNTAVRTSNLAGTVLFVHCRMLNYVNKTHSEYSIHLSDTFNYSSELHTKCIKMYHLLPTRYNLNTLHIHEYIAVASGGKIIKIFCK
jgi:hypothetical protein